jgi:uncharacterized protein YdeI (YjbR/CyaY-like superfamily)
MNSIYLATLEEWHNWLLQNYTSVKEVWLIFYKKHTCKASLNYEDAVEEALCFGWIDSLIKKLDEEKYARKFTPRTNFRKWSNLNIKRMNKLITEGRMRPEGLAKITPEILTRRPRKHPDKLIIPAYIEKKFNSTPEAAANFNKLPPSHKKRYIGWIDDAKREETKLRRLEQAIEMLRKNEKLSMK